MQWARSASGLSAAGTPKTNMKMCSLIKQTEGVFHHLIAGGIMSKILHILWFCYLTSHAVLLSDRCAVLTMAASHWDGKTVNQRLKSIFSSDFAKASDDLRVGPHLFRPFVSLKL